MKLLLKFISNINITIKLTFFFSLLGIVSVLWVGNWIIQDVGKTQYEQQMTIEMEALSKLSQFTSDTYNKVYDLLVVTNSKNSISGILEKNSFSITDRNQNETTKNLISIMETISISNDFIDFVVISLEGKIFSVSQTLNRSLVSDYDYTKSKYLGESIKNKSVISLRYDDQTEYVKTKNSEAVVSFTGNFINLNQVPNVVSVGYYIINVPASKFVKSYNMKIGTSQVKSDYIVIDQDEKIVFMSNKAVIDQLSFEDREKYLFGRSGASEDNDYYWYKEKIPKTKMSIIQLIDKEVFNYPIQVQKNKINMVILISIFSYILLTMIISKRITKKIIVLLTNMKKVMEGNFKVQIPVGNQDEIGRIYKTFNDMCNMLDDAINRIYISELKQKEAELLALQAQINPHYLYNTLELIRSRAVVDNNYEIERMIFLLGEIFRWNSKTKEYIVRIDDEIENITQYLELQELRFENRFETAIDVDDCVIGMGIPKMLLQPIVENSIVHGFADKEGLCNICILVKLEEQSIHIIIKDNGIGMDSKRVQEVLSNLSQANEELDVYSFGQEKGDLESLYKLDTRNDSSIGLSNVNNRIKLLFGQTSGIDIETNETEGTTITIKFPAMKREDMITYARSNHS
jgi:two-component system, sensor histidine kinase YesM